MVLLLVCVVVCGSVGVVVVGGCAGDVNVCGGDVVAAYDAGGVYIVRGDGVTRCGCCCCCVW